MKVYSNTVKDEALHNVEDDNSGNKVGHSFLGTVFALMPSGKFYMPWTTNQTEEDVEKDAKFGEALFKVAEEHRMFIENGEDDPCDLFACIIVEDENDKQKG